MRPKQKLKGEDLLVIADPQEKYGENWIVCLTRESFEAMISNFISIEETTSDLAPLPSTIEEIVSVYEDRPIIAKAWESPSIHETYEQVRALDVHSKRPLVRFVVFICMLDNC